MQLQMTWTPPNDNNGQYLIIEPNGANGYQSETLGASIGSFNLSWGSGVTHYQVQRYAIFGEEPLQMAVETIYREVGNTGSIKMVIACV